jgi:hypothetical protein
MRLNTRLKLFKACVTGVLNLYQICSILLKSELLFQIRFLSGIFQIGGQQLADEEKKCCLAAVLPPLNTTNLSLYILMSILPTLIECTERREPG